MHNSLTELPLNDISVQKMSTTVRRQRRASFSTTSLIKYDNSRNNVIFGNGKSRNLSTLFVEEEEEIVEIIVRELKNLLAENESESHTTAVEIDQELEDGDDMKFDLNDDEFYISSPLMMDQSHQEDILNDIVDINDLSSSQIELTTTSRSSLELQPSDDSYNRICSAVQSLINDAQVALQKPNPSSSNQLLGLPQTTTRPRAQSWSSNVSSWIMNQYNPSSMVCECGTCWLCLESCNSLSSTTTTTRPTPKSSRANSLTSAHTPPLSLTSQQQESFNTYNRQVNLAGIKKQYRKKLESRSSYRKSCDDLDMALQKLISTAVSAGVEHGLTHSPIYRQYSESMERDDSGDRYDYFRNHDDDEINYDNKSSKWRRRIWNCLQKMGINFNNKNNNDKENVEEQEGIEDGYGSYSSYSSYNSSWNSSSDYQENSNEDTSDPFSLNIGQNIFNFNVNLINSTTNNYNKTTNNSINEIDNSIHTTTNNYQNCYNTINNYEEKSSQSTYRQSGSKKIKSLATKFTNMLAMIGLIISMSQTIILNPTNTPALMSVAARNIIRSNVKRRRSRGEMILMIKVIKYVSVLFVGWAAGRIGKKQKDSSDGNNGRIKEIPSNKSNY
ncbi:18242_t:CDS:2 [Rhizophagus irregularis]|nr:18242_t:CDS:2 [Rhizophagus irregularis]